MFICIYSLYIIYLVFFFQVSQSIHIVHFSNFRGELKFLDLRHRPQNLKTRRCHDRLYKLRRDGKTILKENFAKKWPRKAELFLRTIGSFIIVGETAVFV